MVYFGENGFLKIIIGSMFSGKTSELLNIYRLYTLCNIDCCIINHTFDKRYHKTMISSHDKIMLPCIQCLNLKDTVSKESFLDQYKVILINEAQFFDDLYEYTRFLVEEKKKIVYFCGLDGDFKRQKF